MTTKSIRQVRPWLGAALVASALVLSGCFHNDDETSTPPNTAAAVFPANISTISGFIDLLVSLVTTTDDTSEAVALGDFEAPLDDVGPPDTRLFQ